MGDYGQVTYFESGRLVMLEEVVSNPCKEVPLDNSSEQEFPSRDGELEPG